MKTPEWLKANRFGNMLKLRRMELNITLRQFALKHKQNAGNLSKIERGVSLPRYQNLNWFLARYDLRRGPMIEAYLADLADKINEVL